MIETTTINNVDHDYFCKQEDIKLIMHFSTSMSNWFHYVEWTKEEWNLDIPPYHDTLSAIFKVKPKTNSQ